MATAITAPPTGIQRGRGGFMRSVDDVPYVSDPSGDRVKAGARQGEIKRIPYGQPSNRGMLIENSTNLTKWGERRCVFGIGRDPALVEACRALTGLEIDSDEYKTAADAIIIAAKDAAKAHLAADRGTHVHLLTEDFDDGRDWVLRAEAGELVDLDREIQNALVAGWHRMLAGQQLQVLAVEASCVDDAWRLAGTLDRILRVGKTLRFAKVTGEVVEIPAGTVLVGDVKTSSKRLDRNGVVQYWSAYSIQIASYAQSQPYDTETEERGEWPWPISQTHALILHPDIDTCEWELIYVDLEAGRTHGGQCVVDAKAWERRNDIFSVSQLDAPQPTPAFAVVVTATEEACIASAEPSSVAHLSPAPAAPARAGEGVDGSYEPALTPSPADRLALVDARGQLTTAPDEGADLSAQTYQPGWGELQRCYDALDPAGRAWLADMVGESRRRGVSFHSQEVRSVRVFSLYRALITLCEAGGDQDELLRALVALVIGDVALFPGIHPGHVVGSLSADEATKFADLVDTFVGNGLAGHIDDSGLFRLVAV